MNLELFVMNHEELLIKLYLGIGVLAVFLDCLFVDRILYFVGTPSVGHGVFIIFLIVCWPCLYLFPKPPKKYRKGLY